MFYKISFFSKLILCISLFLIPSGILASEDTLKVVKDGNLRSGPSTKSSIIGEVKTGMQVTRIEKSDGWYKVQLPDGKIGWVYQSLISSPDLKKSHEEQSVALDPDYQLMLGMTLQELWKLATSREPEFWTGSRIEPDMWRTMLAQRMIMKLKAQLLPGLAPGKLSVPWVAQELGRRPDARRLAVLLCWVGTQAQDGGEVLTPLCSPPGESLPDSPETRRLRARLLILVTFKLEVVGREKFPGLEGMTVPQAKERGWTDQE